MKKGYQILLCMIMSIVALCSISFAATTLSPGDIFIITANGNPDMIEFVSRVDMTTGTVVRFSDDGRTSAGTWRGTEGYITFTSSRTISSGTIVRLSGLHSATQTVFPTGAGAITKNNTFDLTTAGESILVYQGTPYNQVSPTFLYGLGFGSGVVWINSGTPTSNTSYLPASLNIGSTVTTITSGANVQYNCSNIYLGDPSFVTSINNPNNWNKNPLGISFSPSPCVFSLVPPVPSTGDFVTTWKTDNPGSSCTNCITIPTIGSGYNYDIDVNNDGIFDIFGLTGDYTHNFGTSGTYTIRIRGDFPRIYLQKRNMWPYGDPKKILSVDQRGTGSWTSMAGAFYDASNLRVLATDAPNLSNADSTSAMFFRASSMNDPIGHWDMSTIQSMSAMFMYTSFNQPLSGWDTSSVTNMSSMFAYSLFNQDISAWDTSSVTGMSAMFSYATQFNQPINSRSTSSVTDMNNMFSFAKVFNQSLSGWDTSSVTNMTSMFWYTTGFNQNLNNWDTSSVTSIANIFSNARSFNQPLNDWDVSNVTQMYHAFSQARQFNQPLSGWDTSNAISMVSAFDGAGQFNQDISSWNIQHLENAGSFLRGATSFSVENYDLLLSGWNAQSIIKPNVPFTGRYYCNSNMERQHLITTHGWIISDLGQQCPPPTIIITAPTKLSSGSITNTTIVVTGGSHIFATGISINTGTNTAGVSNLVCNQIDLYEVHCTVSIDSSGHLGIRAINAAGTEATDIESFYIIDTIKPAVPHISVETESPYTINNPQVSFSSTDNVALDYCMIEYAADDGLSGSTGTISTISPASSPIALTLDPDSYTHTIIVRCYDAAGNWSENEIVFPPIISFSTPTVISNTGITNASVTITSPGGNDIDSITIASNSGTTPTLSNCVGSGGDLTPPYASPVVCQIDIIDQSQTITIQAQDVITNGVGKNSTSFIIETIKPTITIVAPTLLSHTGITTTTILITDDTALSLTGISIGSGTSHSHVVCTQMSYSNISCTIQIDASGDLSVTVTDVAGNEHTASQIGYIIDTIAPTITLTQDVPTTPHTGITIQITAGDNIGLSTGSLLYGFTNGTCNSSIGFIDTYASGVPFIIDNEGYNGLYLCVQAIDLVGNTTYITSTNPVLVDTTSPVVTLIGSGIVIEQGEVFSDLGAAWTDIVDGNGVVVVATSGMVDINTLGTYVLEYTYTDTAGNTGNIVARTVTVVDTTPPVVTLIGSGIITINQGSGFTDPGASRTDLVDGSGLILTATSGTVDINTPGTYTLQYTYTDTAGNTSTITRTVIVQTPTNTGSTVTPPRTGGGGGQTPVVDDTDDEDDTTPVDPVVQPSVPQSVFNPSISASTCFNPLDKATIDQGIRVTEYFKTAHQMLYSYELTKRQGTKDYRPFDTLTREEAARFMVEFAEKVLCRTKTRTYNNYFSDIDGADSTLTSFITASYEYEIFNGDANKDGDKITTFRPKDTINRDELIAVMIRLITNEINDSAGTDWAQGYKTLLNQYTSHRSLTSSTQRDNIAETIYSLYRDNEYTLEEVGYVVR